MIGIKAGQLEGKVGEVKATLRKFAVRKIYRMSGYQQAVERTSMKKAPGASPAGTPPHTHPRTSKKTGKNLPAFPQSIRFKVEDKGLQSRSVVGPAKPSKGRKANWAERIGKTHEFGGTARVEKRVVYRPVRAGETGTWLGIGKKAKVKKDGKGGKEIRKNLISKSVVLFRKGGKEKTFNFTIHEQKYSRGKMIFRISYQAAYPKRPFAAPALRKTIAATRQGKFG